MKKRELSDAKRRSINMKRFWILFLIWAMAVGLLAAVTAGAKIDDIPRIVIFVILIVASVIYWAAFFIIFRREKQREKGSDK